MSKSPEKIFPVLSWSRSYQKSWLKGDLSAGLTVGIMLIPQGMAYAMMAGMPPIYGLYAALIPLLLYVIFGTSRHLSVGPVAIVSLLVAAGIGEFAIPGSNEFISMAITLALLVGIVQLILGLLRLGFLVNFLSQPVISGFTSAAAFIIGISQLRHLLGLDIQSRHFTEILLEATGQLDLISWPTFGIGFFGMLVIILLKRVNPLIPGPIIVVIVSTLLVFGFGLSESGVRIIGEVPVGLPQLELPELSVDRLSRLLPLAIAVALVSFMQSIAASKAILTKKNGEYEVHPSQELIALGMANIGGSLSNSFPVAGGFARTAVNSQAGANSGLAAVISVGLVIMTLLFLTPLFVYMPQAVLASIIMVAVVGLIDAQTPKELWKEDRKDFWMLVITFLVTLIWGIQEGILAGVIISVSLVLYQSAYPHIAILGRIPGTNVFRNVNRFPEAKSEEGMLIIRIDAALYFANANYLSDKIQQFSTDPSNPIHLVILNAESISSIDSSSTRMLRDLISSLRAEGKDLVIAGAIGPVRDQMYKNGLLDLLGTDHVFPHVHHAVAAFTSASSDEVWKRIALQADPRKKK